MNRLLFICILAGLVNVTTFAQEKNQPKAWEITFKTRAEPLPNTSQEELEKIKRMNENLRSSKDVVLLSDSLYRISEIIQMAEKRKSASTSLIINRRDSVVYDYNGYRDVYIQENYGNYLKRTQENTILDFLNIKKHPNSEKTISGWNTKKMTYDIFSTETSDTIDFVIWYSKNLPHWFMKIEKFEFPGFLLRTEFKSKSADNHLKFIKEAVSIKPVTLKESDFVPPEGTEIVDKNTMKQNEETHSAFSRNNKNTFENVARDSILNILDSIKAKSVVEKGSVFQNGFARITNKEKSYYIDKKGNLSFHQLIAAFHPIDSIWQTRPGYIHIERKDSVTHFIVQKNKQYGLVNGRGQWLMPTRYDAIRLEHNRRLSISKDGKMGIANTWGEIILPPKFDEVKIMDGTFFDVRKGDKWGIYSAKQQKMVLPFDYDGFDFCGGCGGTVEYAYASKNGKWGAISFEGKILVPFEYEHPGHYGMRGDNWVTSFEKNGKDVIINMDNQTVFSEAEYQDIRLLNGILAVKKEGKYGFISADGKKVTDFIYDDITDPYGNFTWGPYVNITKNGKEGIIRNDGKVIIAPNKYDNVFVFGNYFSVEKNGENGLLDSLGKMVVPLEYDEVIATYDLEMTTKNGKKIKLFELITNELSGFYNPENNKIVQPQFSRIGLIMSLDSTQMYVQVNTKWGEDYYDVHKGLYSLSGKEMMPVKYDDFSFISPNLLSVEKEDKKGLYQLNKKKEIVLLKYDYINTITDRYLKMGNYGEKEQDEKLWDRKKRKFVQLPFSEIKLSDVENVLIVSDASKMYLYNLDKQKTITKAYPDSYHLAPISTFEHGLARVVDSGKFGHINPKGEVVIPPKYEGVAMSDDGFIRLSQKTGEHLWQDIFVDSLGKKINNKTYSRNSYYGASFSDIQLGDFLVVTEYDEKQRENRFGLIDLNGNEIIPPEYEEIFYLENNQGFIVKQHRKFGIFDENGNEIFPVVLDNVFFGEYINRYSDLKKVKSEFPVLVQLGDTYFYITQSGEIMPLIVKDRQGYQKSNWR